MNRKIIQLLHDFVYKYKIISITIVISIFSMSGLFISSEILKADLTNTFQTIINEKDISTIFTEYDNFKEIEIKPLGNNKFKIIFFATKWEWDSLHEYSYIIEKEGKVLYWGFEI